jgi:hypothetical protein
LQQDASFAVELGDPVGGLVDCPNVVLVVDANGVKPLRARAKLPDWSTARRPDAVRGNPLEDPTLSARRISDENVAIRIRGHTQRGSEEMAALPIPIAHGNR